MAINLSTFDFKALIPPTYGVPGNHDWYPGNINVNEIMWDNEISFEEAWAICNIVSELSGCAITTSSQKNRNDPYVVIDVSNGQVSSSSIKQM